MAHPPVVAVDTEDSDGSARAEDSVLVHEKGIPHRVVHIEIVNNAGKYLVWRRSDGRLEIPGGHVDWLPEEFPPRAEKYEEAALREAVEELGWVPEKTTIERWEKTMELLRWWGVVGQDCDMQAMEAKRKEELEKARRELRKHCRPELLLRIVNQLPSSHGNNNEWVTVYRLHWPKERPENWPKHWDVKQIEGSQEEGIHGARWWTVAEIRDYALENPMLINAALRLFLRRQEPPTLVPLELDFLDEKQKPSSAGFGNYECVIRKKRKST